MNLKLLRNSYLEMIVLIYFGVVTSLPVVATKCRKFLQIENTRKQHSVSSRSQKFENSILMLYNSSIFIHHY